MTTTTPEVASSRVPSLSPSRANDFGQCPLLFRFRVVDRLPEPPSAAALRGTLVHVVLQRLFDAPAGKRTPQTARELLAPCWEQMVAERPECTDVLPDATDLTDWFAAAAQLLDRYFTLEDPNRIEPAERELMVRSELDGLELRGIVDRLDVAPDGAMRVVDYKTGRSPGPGFESAALFQLRFYALVLAKMRGRVPAMLQLVYLGDGTVLRHELDAQELARTEQRIRAVWTAICAAARTGRWEPRKGPLCAWCAHQQVCPAFGGIPPEVSAAQVTAALGVAPDPS